jgi:Type II secretion system (T2SS), protein E, N-terminal domain
MAKKKIGELMREAGAVALEDVKQALGGQRSWGAGQRLGQLLVALGKASPQQVARALAEQSGLPYIELSEIPASVSALVPLEFQAEHQVVPFRVESDGRTDRILVAVADPTNLEIVDELRFQLARHIRVFVASSADIEMALKALRGEITGRIDPLEIEEDGEELVLDTQEASMVPDGWFSGPEPAMTDPRRSPERVKPAQPAPPPASPVLQQVRSPRPSNGSTFSATSAAAADLDNLLGTAGHPPPPPPVPPRAVPVPQAGPRPGASASLSAKAPGALPEEDLRILQSLERLARGQEVSADSAKLRPAQMVASLIQLLLRKGVISDAELVRELRQK